MSSKIKKHIIDKLYHNIFSNSKLATIEQLAPQLSINRRPQPDLIEFFLPIPVTVDHENEKEFQSVQVHNPTIPVDNVVQTSRIFENSLKVAVDQKEFIKDVLDSNPTELNFKPQRRKVIVEFSSPNVAKPFHAGHMRSTIIGNFISNIKRKLGKDVVKINYLGDWGTQFGLLKVGVELLKIDDAQLKTSPTKSLYDAYVWINREAELNPSLHEQAREEFRKLEDGDESAKQVWSKFIALTTEELQKTYSRLGVKFDEYQWESDFGKNEVSVILDRLREQGLLETDGKGRECARVRGKTVPLVRSDGASLYLARDIAAAHHRRRTANFNEMLYVVENGQADHFLSLFSICQDLGLDEAWNMRHVKFGRIHGMSTRKGQVVFLSDVLDQARDLVMERLVASKTTKVEPTLELADQIGSAAVIVNDLKQRRIKDYEFSWDKALQVAGDTAVRLQYTHCRLHSILANSSHTPAAKCDPGALSEPEAVALAMEIARYEESILKAHADLEACTLVVYLFYLSHAANKAIKELPVKGSGGHLASQRLLLFSRCKQVLSEGLTLLGITPLEQM